MIRRSVLLLCILMCAPALARWIPVTITWEDDPQTTATISWERDIEGRGTVRYGTTTNYDQAVSDWGGVHRHSIKLEDLEPDTLYHYAASSSDGFQADDHTFRTAPTPTGSLHFVVHGDLQGGGSWSAARGVARAITNDGPDLVIHVGDIFDEWLTNWWVTFDHFFSATTDELERVVFMPAAGNHDDSQIGNSHYWKTFHLPRRPSNGSYYSYDAGNVHFVALNSDHDLEGQTNWLMRDLQGAANDPEIDWIFPYFHRPPYSLGYRSGDDDTLTNFCPAFVMYEADVVFSGHSHNYQRWKSTNGVSYFVAGGGGGYLYDSDFTPSSHEFATTCYHFVSGHVTGDLFNVRGIRSDGQVFDSAVYTNVGRAVQVSPVFPRRGETVTIGYDPSQGTLAGVSPIYLHLGIDDFTSALVSSQMTYNAGTGRWEYDYVVPSTASNRLAFVFRDSSSSTWDNNHSHNWQVLLDRVTFSPDPPAVGSNVTITYAADMGPLAGSGQVYMRIGFDDWEQEADSYLAMTNTAGNDWEYTYAVPAWAEEVDVMFSSGSTRDDNYGMDWRKTTTGASADEPIDPLPMIVAGTPVISSNPPTIQNNIGDNFDLSMFGGSVKSEGMAYGFGDFGQVYLNYDSSNLYVGGVDASLGGSNNVLVLFLGLDTLSDDATNLWHKSGQPQTLDFMHNVGFLEPMDIAIVFGDEFGDDPDYYSFTYPTPPSWYNFGQGIYYIGTGNSTFDVVTGARLSQFDGDGTTAVTTNDMDGNRRTDRWEASLPWSSLGAAGGITNVNWVLAAGVIGSSSTNGKNRYLSSTYLGERTYGARHGFNNLGYDFLSIEPTKILLETGDCDNDNLPNQWEHEQFGSSDGPPPGEDTDGDGASNGDEYVAGTQPTNAASVFAGDVAISTGKQIVITWPGAIGRTYAVHTADTLADSFAPLATNLAVNIYTDTVSGAETRFYQLEVQYP